jgi:hypothetical protein
MHVATHNVSTRPLGNPTSKCPQKTEICQLGHRNRHLQLLVTRSNRYSPRMLATSNVTKSQPFSRRLRVKGDRSVLPAWRSSTTSGLSKNSRPDAGRRQGGNMPRRTSQALKVGRGQFRSPRDGTQPCSADFCRQRFSSCTTPTWRVELCAVTDVHRKQKIAIFSF